MKNGVFIEGGNTYYYVNDRLHREGGPTIIYGNNRGEAWHSHGLLHRIGGPAVINVEYGSEEYYYQGEFVKAKSTEEFLKLVKLRFFW
jgi:hypothetical protein